MKYIVPIVAKCARHRSAPKIDPAIQSARDTGNQDSADLSKAKQAKPRESKPIRTSSQRP
jgi:hypothetical protein